MESLIEKGYSPSKHKDEYFGPGNLQCRTTVNHYSRGVSYAVPLRKNYHFMGSHFFVTD